jgi:hypothetical protein
MGKRASPAGECGHLLPERSCVVRAQVGCVFGFFCVSVFVVCV